MSGDVGRPTVYTDELSDDICERIACGESMRSISRDKSMPAMSTLFKWLRENRSFSQQYAIAKQESADAWADDIIDIADNGVGNPLLIDGIAQVNEDGKPIMIVDGPAVGHAKLKIDSRKWSAAKLKPKKYGEKVQNEHSGVDGSPIETVVLSKEEYAKVRKQMLEDDDC